MNTTELTDKFMECIVEKFDLEPGVDFCPYVDWSDLNDAIINVQEEAVRPIKDELEETRKTAAWAIKKYPDKQEYWEGVASAQRNLVKFLPLTRPNIDEEEYRKMDQWISVENELPVSDGRKLLVTNNIKARNSHGEMSHFWLVTMIHGSREAGFSSFDECDNRLHRITHWRYALPKEDTNEN